MIHHWLSLLAAAIPYDCAKNSAFKINLVHFGNLLDSYERLFAFAVQSMLATPRGACLLVFNRDYCSIDLDW